MELEKKYALAYSKIEQVIQNRRRQKRYPAMGYTSNLDLLCDFRVDTLNMLLKKYTPDAVLSQMTAAINIRSMEELLSTIVYFCRNGIGGEVDIENVKLVEDSFHWEYGMGGTAVQAAMALAAIGCPSIVHLTDDSREVCEILKSPYIYTVSEKGELIHTDEVAQTQEQEIHFIIQFKKGDIISLGAQKIVIPASNRLILTKITVNKFLPLSDTYFNYIEKHAEEISSNVLSSFNAVLYTEVLTDRLACVKEHIIKYKENNPSGIVFFEDAHYHSTEVRKLCISSIYSYVDILSLNEEELKYTLEMYEFDIDIDNILSCIEGTKFIRKNFGVKKGIIVHTKDYSMYVGDMPEADIESGLMYGNLLATAKAEYGWYGTKEQIGEIAKLPLSQRGLRNREIVKSKPCAPEVILVPTKYIDKPKYTIGLGDTFVAGVQMCF